MKKPSLDPKQFKHRPPLEVTTERFMLSEQRRLIKVGKAHGLEGEALHAWLKLPHEDRITVARANKRMLQSRLDIIDNAQEARRIAKQRALGSLYGGTMTGRFSVHSGPVPPLQNNVPQSGLKPFAIDIETVNVDFSAMEKAVMKHYSDMAARMRSIGLIK